MLITPVVAAGTTQITITPNKSTAYRGEEIRFTVSISGSNACTSVGVAFSFDTNVFELVEAEANASNATVNNVNLGQKLFAIRYKESTKPSGQIGYFVLKVKSAAAFAATTISGTVSVKNVDANVNLATSAETPQVSWAWAFEGNDDVKDTALGDIAANATAPTISLQIVTTVTQIDN